MLAICFFLFFLSEYTKNRTWLTLFCIVWCCKEPLFILIYVFVVLISALFFLKISFIFSMRVYMPICVYIYCISLCVHVCVCLCMYVAHMSVVPTEPGRGCWIPEAEAGVTWGWRLPDEHKEWPSDPLQEQDMLLNAESSPPPMFPASVSLLLTLIPPTFFFLLSVHTCPLTPLTPFLKTCCFLSGQLLYSSIASTLTHSHR